MFFIASTLYFTEGVEGQQIQKSLFPIQIPQERCVLGVLLKLCSLHRPTTRIIRSQLALSLEFKLSDNEEFQLEVYFSTK